MAADQPARPSGPVRSRIRATPLRGYAARQREMTEAFNLPPDLREWVTVRYDPRAPEGSPALAINVCATVGHTTTVVPLDLDVGGEVSQMLGRLVDENRDELHHRLKLDLATNLMAQSTMGMEGDAE